MKRSIFAIFVLVCLCLFSSNSWAQRAYYDCEAATLAVYEGAMTYSETYARSAVRQEANFIYDHNSFGRPISPQDMKDLLKPVFETRPTDEASAYFLALSTYGQCKAPYLEVSQTPETSTKDEMQCLAIVQAVADASAELHVNGMQAAMSKYGSKLPDLREHLPGLKADLISFLRKHSQLSDPFVLFIVDQAAECIRMERTNG